MSTGRTGIVIAQYGQSDLTCRCVAEIQRQHVGLEYDVIVVDDGSPTAADRRRLRSLKTRTTLVALPRNRGVTAAWNRGAELLLQENRCDRLVFLNNDVLTSGPWLQPLVAPLTEFERGITGVQQRIERQLPFHLLHRLPAANLLSGWCLALHRNTFLALNGFDPRLEMYYSDTDLQYRLLRLHIAHNHSTDSPLIAVPQLPLQHLQHRTARTTTTRQASWNRDRNRFIAKWTAILQRPPMPPE